MTNKQIRVCKLDGCNRSYRARGWCSLHYRRWKTNGSPGSVELLYQYQYGGVCSIEGCNKEYEARGYCSMHRRRKLLHGDPLFVLVQKQHPEVCLVENCGGEYASKGYCDKHYRRVRKHGSPNDPIVLTRDYTCSVNRCNNTYHSSGLCRKHHEAFVARPKRKALKNGGLSDFTFEQWEEKLQEYSNCCAYCRAQIENLTQDHVIPLSRGGSHTKSNIVPACAPCNSRKWASVGKYLPWHPDAIRGLEDIKVFTEERVDEEKAA